MELDREEGTTKEMKKELRKGRERKDGYHHQQLHTKKIGMVSSRKKRGEEGAGIGESRARRQVLGHKVKGCVVPFATSTLFANTTCC